MRVYILRTFICSRHYIVALVWLFLWFLVTSYFLGTFFFFLNFIVVRLNFFFFLIYEQFLFAQNCLHINSIIMIFPNDLASKIMQDYKYFLSKVYKLKKKKNKNRSKKRKIVTSAECLQSA